MTEPNPTPPTETPPANTPPPTETPPTETPPEATPPTDGTIIQDGGTPPEETPPATYWPEDWRAKVAEHYAAGDDKVMKKELKRLERFTDPTALYGFGREAESKLTSGGLIKMPGKDAKPEEIAEFHKTLGVPEKPEGYFENLELAEGLVLGDEDKVAAEQFAEAVHGSGATPAVVTAALNWYLQTQEDQAAALDEADEKFKTESQTALKEEFGPALQRIVNSVGALFATAPGGNDLMNEGSLYARLMGGRMADGRLIGNDPDMVRFLNSMSHEINPAATVVEDGDQSGESVEAEIAAIEASWRDPKTKREYFKDEAKQARYRQLLETRDKIQARKNA